MTEQRVSPLFEGHANVCTISTPGGTDEGLAFLADLDNADRAKFQRYLERLRDGLHVKNPENMRHIKDEKDPKKCGAEVHELKVHRNGGKRLYVVRFQGRWYVTHGASKPKDSQVRKQVRKAFAIFWGE
jgi:phage-related protein